jgi:hypothetical protein
MPADVAPTQRMTATEYLVWERAQVERHEYHLGEVFAMAGGSLRHNLLSMSAGAALHAAMRDRGCVVLSSNQRIAAKRDERYVYADAVVVCGGVENGKRIDACHPSPTISSFLRWLLASSIFSAKQTARGATECSAQANPSR